MSGRIGSSTGTWAFEDDDGSGSATSKRGGFFFSFYLFIGHTARHVGS